jgi:hypothetical protein
MWRCLSTASAPGSSRTNARSADASRSTHLTLRLGTPVGNEFVDYRATFRDNTVEALAQFRQRRALGPEPYRIVLKREGNDIAGAQAEMAPQFRRQDDPAGRVDFPVKGRSWLPLFLGRCPNSAISSVTVSPRVSARTCGETDRRDSEWLIDRPFGTYRMRTAISQARAAGFRRPPSIRHDALCQRCRRPLS